MLGFSPQVGLLVGQPPCEADSFLSSCCRAEPGQSDLVLPQVIMKMMEPPKGSALQEM